MMKWLNAQVFARPLPWSVIAVLSGAIFGIWLGGFLFRLFH